MGRPGWLLSGAVEVAECLRPGARLALKVIFLRVSRWLLSEAEAVAECPPGARLALKQIFLRLRCARVSLG